MTKFLSALLITAALLSAQTKLHDGTDYPWSSLASRPFVKNAQTSTYQVLAADFDQCKTITVASGTFTITLVASGSQPADGKCINVLNYGSGVVTVARSGQNINGAAANLTMAAGSASAPTGLRVISDATNYFAQPFITGSASGVSSIDTATGAILLGAGLSRASQTISFDSAVLSGVYLANAGSNALLAGTGNTCTSSATTPCWRLVGSARPSSPTAGALNISLAGAFEWYDGSAWNVAGTSSGANTTLSNLGTTNLNAALLFQTGLDIGSTAAPPRNIRFYGSGTFGSHSFTFGGTPTAHRNVTFPDVAATVAVASTSTTATQVLFATTTAGAPAYRAIAASDLPATPLITPGTTPTLVGPRGYAICTGTCTVSVPVPVAGYEFCVVNDDNVATAITLSALGSSAMYENSNRTAYGTAGTGTLVVAAALKNKVCLLGRDSTHYLLLSNEGGAITVN